MPHAGEAIYLPKQLSNFKLKKIKIFSLFSEFFKNTSVFWLKKSIYIVKDILLRYFTN